MSKFVYLAGPITGCTMGEAREWRAEVALELSNFGIIGISPLRCEPIVEDARYGLSYPDPKFGTAQAIGSKNLFDVRHCDMVLAYLPMPSISQGHQSWGTIIEIAWAFALEKPAILVTNDLAVKQHPVIQACAGWMLDNLDDGVETLIGILGGYTKGGKNL